MRLLFFLEPFPVRRRPLDFLWVVDRWSQTARELTRRGVAVGWACGDEVARHRPLTPVTTPQSLGFSLPEPPDDASADARWVCVMKDPAEPTWAPVVRAMLEAHQPDVVITWTINAALQRECRERGVLLVHQELGPLRAPQVPLFYADPRGVNGACSIQALWPDLERLPWTALEEAQLERWGSVAYPPPAVRAQRRAELGLDPQRRTIAVFGQVSRDSNVLAWSRVDGNRGLFEVLAAAADPERFQLVVKHHPAEAATPVPAGVLVAPQTMPAGELVAACDWVATINSSVALEALLQSRPLYLFGDGPFSGVGASRDVEGQVSALARRLREDPPGLIPLEDLARRRLLRFLLLRYFRSDEGLSDADALLTLLSSWLDLNARGAPLLDYFPETNVGTRLREDGGAQRTAQLAAQVAAARQEVLVQQALLEEQRLLLAQAQQELASLESSVGIRAVRALKHLPGVYPAYLAAKRRL